FGVEPQEVVEPVAARPAVVDEVHSQELVQAPLRHGERPFDQARGGLGGEIGSGDEAEQPEEAASGRGEAAVGGAEDGADGGDGAALELEDGQAIPSGEEM